MKHTFQTKFEVGQTVWARSSLPPYEPKAFVITGYDLCATKRKGRKSTTCVLYHTERGYLFTEQMLSATVQECSQSPVEIPEVAPSEPLFKNY